MSRKVVRHEIAADEKAHIFTFDGTVLKVDCTREDSNELEFWVDALVGETTTKHNLRAFKDGQEVPDDATYCGTTSRAPDGTVWHLFKVV